MHLLRHLRYSLFYLMHVTGTPCFPLPCWLGCWVSWSFYDGIFLRTPALLTSHQASIAAPPCPLLFQVLFEHVQIPIIDRIHRFLLSLVFQLGVHKYSGEGVLLILTGGSLYIPALTLLGPPRAKIRRSDAFLSSVVVFRWHDSLVKLSPLIKEKKIYDSLFTIQKWISQIIESICTHNFKKINIMS